MIINWPDETLKALIASRVFGWRVEYKGGGGVDEYGWKVYGSFLPAPRLCRQVESHAWLPVPDYPNDIAAAWQVVEWMTEKGWEVSIEGKKWGGGWRARIVNSVWGEFWQKRLAYLYAKTAPRAICEAALKALEAAGSD